MAKKKPVKVHVVKYANEKNLVLRYVDPITGRQKRKSARTKNPKEAERAAERWQNELLQGKFKAPEDLTWEEFRDRFEDQSLGDKSSGYFAVFHSAFKRFEEITDVQMLRDVRCRHDRAVSPVQNCGEGSKESQVTVFADDARLR